MKSLQKSMNHSCEKSFDYSIHYHKRNRVMRLEIDVDKKLRVIVPFGISFSDIERFLKSKKNWIERTLRRYGDYIIIPARGDREEYLKYKEVARDILTKKIIHWNTVYDFSYNAVHIKNLRTRWGSCSGRKNLNFNYKTIFLDDELSDYIVVHELCHLQEMNHSKAFWSLVGVALPEYSLHKKRLSKMICR